MLFNEQEIWSQAIHVWVTEKQNWSHVPKSHLITHHFHSLVKAYLQTQPVSNPHIFFFLDIWFGPISFRYGPYRTGGEIKCLKKNLKQYFQNQTGKSGAFQIKITWLVCKQQKEGKFNSSILGHFKWKCKCHHMTKSTLIFFLGHFILPPVLAIEFNQFSWLNRK